MRTHTPQLIVGTFSPIASIDEVEGRKPFIEAINEQTKILWVVQYLGIGQGSSRVFLWWQRYEQWVPYPLGCPGDFYGNGS